MTEYRRRLGLISHIERVKKALKQTEPEGEIVHVAIEALIDIMRETGTEYISSGCRDYDFKLDIRPLEERND
ncbi:hypothetical protein X1_49 [Yersinia phage vB_Yen_X1]|nr:hypothetical protein X1_49 [Yersinia phage vB_Yen_X1]